ncbi:hypothetical protein QYE76_009878 [Lolium multiflorum]|uniref:TF-B3 domain-containing protein n=1 Tax=Lolium multiflorum TaxID=4521 RepID=A0AAD8X1L5_LOLMU|nr:hypothetical protein QYE76_009878 [Lolium multiflorum]
MGKHGERSVTTQLKMVLPGSSGKLRISDELAECFDSGDGGAGMTAFLVSPFGTAVWRVEVGRDSDGAFLGRRWPEFVEAHGISVGWFLVLRHEGRGVLTIKAFDTTYFIKEFGQTLTVPGLGEAQIKTGRARKPQFIGPLWHNWMQKMPIPAEFLKHGFISDEELKRRMVTFVTPFREFWHIDLEKDGSNVFFAGVWLKFLESQGVTEGEVLLIRYQGNMIFTIEVFGFTGCRRNLKKQDIRFQQTGNSEETNSSQQTEQSEETNSSQKTGQTEEANSSQKTGRTEEMITLSSQNTEQNEEANPSQKNAHSSKEAQSQKEAQISIRKRKRSEETRIPRSCRNPLNKRTDCEYDTTSQPWIRKQLNAKLRNSIPLPGSFCKKVGFTETCKITFKSSEKKGSWEVHGLVYEKIWQWRLSGGWKMFCRDNGLKEGDVCTFKVLKSKLWHVDIDRC